MLNKPEILLTGGSGLLGRELQKYIKCYAPSHAELDITKKLEPLDRKIQVVIHAAAYTDVPGAEIHKAACYKTNVIGTMHLLEAATRNGDTDNPYFVQISSEHAYHPVNYYSRTKQWADEMVEHYHYSNHLIIRLLFKPKPFPYEYAFFDQITGGDYVDIMVPMILAAIMEHKTGTIYLHTGKKTMFELARRTRPNIKAISVHDIKNVVMPENTYYGN